MKNVVSALAAAILAAGCAASPETSVEPTPRAARAEAPTGSNIPRKNRNPAEEGVRTVSPEELERLRGTGNAGRVGN
jgi:PBP1b-binding outer membrane lipoprotein LpoB